MLTSGQRLGTWVDRGLWAAVPFLDGKAASLGEAVTFWAGPGSFAVPLILLGCLVWHLAGRGVAVPAGIGWVTAAWGLLDGVLLGPSPFFVFVIPGVLIVLAPRQARGKTPPATRPGMTGDGSGGAATPGSPGGSARSQR